MSSILDFLVLIVACTFLVFTLVVMTTELFIPVFIHGFGHTGHTSASRMVAASIIWLLVTFLFVGLTAVHTPWLAEAATVVLAFYLVTALVQVHAATRGPRAQVLDWLQGHGATPDDVRDLMQIRIITDLTAWGCVMAGTVPVVAMATAAVHRVDSNVYPAAVLAAMASGLLMVGGIFLITHLRVCDRLLRFLGQICGPTAPTAFLLQQTDRWMDIYTHSADIWNRGRDTNRRALEGAQVALYRLLKDRSRRIVGIDPMAFMQHAQFLVNDLGQLPNNRDDIRNSSAVTQIVRFAILGDDSILPRAALAPAALTNDKAWTRWPLRRIVGIITIMVGLVSSTLALTDRL